jgi:hypothetical protein
LSIAIDAVDALAINERVQADRLRLYCGQMGRQTQGALWNVNRHTRWTI